MTSSWKYDYTIDDLMTRSRLVGAVKELRDKSEFHLGLKACKHAIEQVEASRFVNKIVNAEYENVAERLETKYQGICYRKAVGNTFGVNSDLWDLWKFQKKKIAAIKELRATGNYGLKVAKETFEEIDKLYVNPRLSDILAMADKLQKIEDINAQTRAAQTSSWVSQNIPTENPPLYMGKIIGWRCFRFCATDNRLKPLSRRDANFSIVGKTVDTAPEPEMHNGYGFWAFKRKSQIIRYGEQWDIPIDRKLKNGGFGDSSLQIDRYVYATVSLSGDIIEHVDGYRASEIEIVALYSHMNNSMRRNMAHRLGWPGRILKMSEGRESYPNTLTEIPNQEA